MATSPSSACAAHKYNMTCAVWNALTAAWTWTSEISPSLSLGSGTSLANFRKSLAVDPGGRAVAVSLNSSTGTYISFYAVNVSAPASLKAYAAPILWEDNGVSSRKGGRGFALAASGRVVVIGESAWEGVGRVRVIRKSPINESWICEEQIVAPNGTLGERVLFDASRPHCD